MSVTRGEGVHRASVERRLDIYRVLETARRQLCCYASDPCDCKYGVTADTRPGTEATGCPELRDLIIVWTGFTPFHRDNSVEDDVRLFREDALERPS